MSNILSILLAIGQNDPQADRKAHIEVSLYIYQQLKSAPFEYGLDNQTKIYSADTQKMLYLQFEKDYDDLVKHEQDGLFSHLNNISSFFQDLYLSRFKNLGFVSPVQPIKNETQVIKQETETLDSLAAKLKEISTDFQSVKTVLLGMEVNIDSNFALFPRFNEYNDIYFKFIDLLVEEEILQNQGKELSELSPFVTDNTIPAENDDIKIKKSFFLTGDIFPQDSYTFACYHLLPSLIRRNEIFCMDILNNKLNVDKKTRAHLISALLTMNFVIDKNKPSAFQQRIIQKAHDILSLITKTIPTETEEKASLTHQNNVLNLGMLHFLFNNSDFYTNDSDMLNLFNFNNRDSGQRKVLAVNKQAYCQLWYQFAKLIAINMDKLKIERLEFGYDNHQILGIKDVHSTIPELPASIICGIYYSGEIDSSLFRSTTAFDNIKNAFKTAAEFILSDQGLLYPHGKHSLRENMAIDILCDFNPVFKILPREEVIEMLNRYIRENNNQFTDNIDRLHTQALAIYKRINFDYNRCPETSKPQSWNVYQALKKYLMFKTPNVLFDTLFFKAIGKLAANKTELTYNAISNVLKTTLQYSDTLEARILKAITGNENGQGGIKINNALLLTLHAKRLAQNVAAVLVASFDEIDNERLALLAQNIKKGLQAKLSESLKPRQYESLFLPTYCSQGRAVLDFDISVPRIDGTLVKIRLSQQDLQSWIKPVMACESNTLINSSSAMSLAAQKPDSTARNIDHNNTPSMR